MRSFKKKANGQRQVRAQGAPRDEPAAKRQKPASLSGLALLLNGVGKDEFFATTWEKRPLVVRSVRAGIVFDVETVLARLGEEKEQFFGPHINAVRYVDGKRVNCNPAPTADEDEDEDGGAGKEDGESGEDGDGDSSSGSDDDDDDDDDDDEPLVHADPDVVRAIYDAGATLQAHQPQHYCPALQALMADLECEFDCLFGANAYLTPPNAQGLAPHHDDIEAFIIQTHGSKTWKLYTPQVELPRDYSTDLLHADIGAPFMEVTLVAGDVLYFPRGTVHEAVTGSQASAHITLSTYQRTSWADFLKVALPLAVDRLAETNVALRRGLPVGFARQLGAAAGADKGQAAIRCLADLVANELVPALAATMPDVAGDAADKFFLDFAVSRLPPHRVKVVEEPLRPKVKSITSIDPSLVRIVEEADAKPGPQDPLASSVTVYNALFNSADHHMMGGPDALDNAIVLTLPKLLLAPLKRLLASWPNPAVVADLADFRADPALGGAANFVRLLHEFKLLSAVGH